MKEIQITKYEANDGKIFNKAEECLSWEKTIAVNTEDLQIYINNFLSKYQNYEEWVRNRLNEPKDFIQCYELFMDSTRGGTFALTLGYPYDSLVIDGYIELDEDFCIEMDKWDDFEKEVKEKFGCFISVDTYYWPK